MRRLPPELARAHERGPGLQARRLHAHAGAQGRSPAHLLSIGGSSTVAAAGGDGAALVHAHARYRRGRREQLSAEQLDRSAAGEPVLRRPHRGRRRRVRSVELRRRRAPRLQSAASTQPTASRSTTIPRCRTSTTLRLRGVSRSRRRASPWSPMPRR
jgi:hypothetical protein